MGLPAHKQAPFVSIPARVHSHTLFRETLLPKYCEPQRTPRESSESDLAQGRWQLLQSFPSLPYLMNFSSSVLICAHLWFQVLRQERLVNQATVATIPIQPNTRNVLPI